MTNKNPLVYIAVFLTLLSFSFTFDKFGIKWFWVDKLQIPIILITTAIILVVMFLWQKWKRDESYSAVIKK